MKHLLTCALLLGFLGLFAEGDTLRATLVVKVISLAIFALSGKLLPRYLTNEEIEDEEV